MHVYIVLFLIQLPLFLGAPATNAPAEAEVPACGRCKWDPRMTNNYALPLNETIKLVKNGNGCIEAQLICRHGEDVYFRTRNTPRDFSHDALRVGQFKHKFNTTIVCNGEGPHWDLHSLRGVAPTQLFKIYCLKGSIDKYPG